MGTHLETIPESRFPLGRNDSRAVGRHAWPRRVGRPDRGNPASEAGVPGVCGRDIRRFTETGSASWPAVAILDAVPA
jgi:hypothetical protein